MTILTSVFWFIVAIGVLVTVHEFGHFWVARRLGVKVLRFSVGFGRPVVRWRAGPEDVEYCIGAIPLGGYVKMLDESEGDVAAEDRERAFNRQSLPVRFAVVFAGPAFNFMFAVLAYWVMFMLGVSGIRPVVGAVERESIAAVAGIEAGHQIMRVGARETETWQGVAERVIGATLRGGPLAVEVMHPESGRRLTLTLPLERVKLDELTQGRFFERLGIQPVRLRLEPVLGQVIEASPAERAGLLAGDRVVAVDGVPLDEWSALVRHIRARPAVPVQLDVERGGAERLSLTVTPDTEEGDGGPHGKIGVAVEPPPPAVVDAFQQRYSARERYSPGQALGRAFSRTGEMSLLTLRVLWKMVLLEVSVKNLSGPISIAHYAGVSAGRGLPWFLGFLAIVSISLGILNLLPIPLLDGGHLMYYCIELLTGRPVSVEAQFFGQRLGIAMLVGLMGLAFYNDLVRLFG